MRRHTKESLREIASKFNSRGEFHKKDPAAYTISRLKGKEFLDSICEHMTNFTFSTPQLILAHILDNVLGEKCLYNTKRIIKPYEIDIFYPTYNLAIEYNGEHWHSDEDTKRRDDIKKKMCEDKNIFLLCLDESIRNFNYETNVKNMIINNIDIINRITNKLITPEQINDVKCEVVYEELTKNNGIDAIKEKISQCERIKDFVLKYEREYNYLRRNKMLHLLDDLRKPYRTYSDEYILNKCMGIKSISELRRTEPNLYSLLHGNRRYLREKAMSHMIRLK